MLECADELLGLRDCIGAIKSKVYILTRVWSGSEIGDGNPKDSIEQVLPTPYVVDLNYAKRVESGGVFKEGDVMLKHISKQSRPLETDVDLNNKDCNKTEKFYYLDDKLYKVTHVKSDYIYWNVHIRKVTNSKVYL